VPLVEPFKISNGVIAEKTRSSSVCTSRNCRVRRVSPMSGSFYSEETPESTWDCLTKELIPLFAERDNIVDRECQRACSIPSRKTRLRSGARDCLLGSRSAEAKRALWKLLGADRISVESGLAVGIYPTIRELLLAIERCWSRIQAAQIKIQPGLGSKAPDRSQGGIRCNTAYG